MNDWFNFYEFNLIDLLKTESSDKSDRNDTVDLLILACNRDRTVSVTKLCNQISHPNRTFSTVPLILNKSA